ncbi:MAG: LysR family transcriptional regulator [Candidatus Helarchaeota archaeon]|nr:LysR family transcriptional regulator [Candidatus Helarchaeota archaeon]
MLNIQFLETFIRIAEFGSFSRTASKLNVSQSAVSQQVEVLEKYFGAELFERSIKGVELTPEGNILLKYSKSIIDNLELAKKEIADSLGKIKGVLKISSSTIPGEHILPRFFINFRKEFPEMSYQIEVNDSEISLNKLREGLIDLAAVGSLESEKEFDFIVLAEEELVLAVPANHDLATKKALDLQEIVKYPYLIREKTSGTRRESERILLKAGIEIKKLQIIAELNTTESILTAISEGLGISLISSIAASKFEQTGLIKCIKLPAKLSAKRKLYLVKQKAEEGKESKLLKTFWEFIKKTNT